MSITHELIEEKLSKYPNEVQNLAREALKFSRTMPEGSVAEHLKNAIRSITKEKKVSE